jgi:formyltetrahydrofolate-dependent phosphoribosylglycinamide formyltransferase
MSKKRLAVLASGRGSNFERILERVKDGFIPAEIVLLITNNPKAGALAIAAQNKVEAKVIIPGEFTDSNTFNNAILKALVSAKVDYIILAGYLKLIGSVVVDRYENKILNIHPALLPSFGGKGMYGHHVHQAVFDSGVKVSGATVHLVNNEYDLGPIVLQRSVSIEDLNKPEDIAARVLKIEHQIYPEAVKLLVENKLIVNRKRVRIKGV